MKFQLNKIVKVCVRCSSICEKECFLIKWNKNFSGMAKPLENNTKGRVTCKISVLFSNIYKDGCKCLLWTPTKMLDCTTYILLLLTVGHYLYLHTTLCCLRSLYKASYGNSCVFLVSTPSQSSYITFVHLFTKCWLRAYYVPGNILSARNKAVNKIMS